MLTCVAHLGGKCGTGTIANKPGQPTCTKCASTMTSNDGNTACACKTGFYDSTVVGVIGCMADTLNTFAAKQVTLSVCCHAVAL